MKTSTATIDKLINDFLAEKTVQPQSKQTYRRYLVNFFNWCNSAAKDIDNLTAKDMADYYTHIQQTFSEYYQKSLITIIRLFFYWSDTNGLYTNIAKSVSRPRVINKFRKDALTDEEIKQLQSVIQSESLIQKRDKAIIMLMLINGIRCIEVSRINIDDIFTKSGVMCCKIQRKGKTNKDDFFSIENSWEYVEDYLHALDRTSGPMFTALSRNSTHQLTAQAVGDVVTKYMKRANIKSNRITPHSLRHTAACVLIRNGVDIYHIQKHLGHSKTAMTELYLQYSTDNIKLNDESGNLLSNYYKKLNTKNNISNNL